MMTENLLNFIQQNTEWAALIVFIVAFAESLVIIGLLIPGWLLLVGIGGMIGADILSFYPIVAAAYLGAVLGESLSFYLGYYYHEKLLSLPIMLKHQKLIDHSHRFFDKHGVSGVFIGRFFGPTRAVVPFIAGISEMSRHTFFWVNTFSGLLWAPLYLIPGILVGAAFALDSEESFNLLLILSLLAISVTMSVKHIRLYSKNSELKHTYWPLIKLLLSIAISLTILTLFIKSPYQGLLMEILSVLWEKL